MITNARATASLDSVIAGIAKLRELSSSINIDVLAEQLAELDDQVWSVLDEAKELAQ